MTLFITKTKFIFWLVFSGIGDYQLRENYCTRMLMESDDDPTLLDRILWIDEKKFSRKGIHNIHNQHHWAHENPRVFKAREWL